MKLKKEFFLIVFIILFIVSLEIVTNYIFKNSIDVIYKKIENIIVLIEELNIKKDKNILTKNEIEVLGKKIEKLNDLWMAERNKLSYFSEHDELEKITKCLVLLEENARNKEYIKSLEDCKEFIYWLEHVKEKDSLKLKNIF